MKVRQKTDSIWSRQTASNNQDHSTGESRAPLFFLNATPAPIRHRSRLFPLMKKFLDSSWIHAINSLLIYGVDPARAPLTRLYRVPLVAALRAVDVVTKIALSNPTHLTSLCPLFVLLPFNDGLKPQLLFI